MMSWLFLILTGTILLLPFILIRRGPWVFGLLMLLGIAWLLMAPWLINGIALLLESARSIRLRQRRPRPEDTFSLEQVALLTGLSLDVVGLEAEWSGDRRMTRKQAQAFWRRMVNKAHAEGRTPSMMLDLSILVFADDAIYAPDGGTYRRNHRRWWRALRSSYILDGSEDGTSCAPRVNGIVLPSGRVEVFTTNGE
jgi:hypothetical protein